MIRKAVERHTGTICDTVHRTGSNTGSERRVEARRTGTRNSATGGDRRRILVKGSATQPCRPGVSGHARTE